MLHVSGGHGAKREKSTTAPVFKQQYDKRNIIYLPRTFLPGLKCSRRNEASAVLSYLTAS